jgi:hypothetical protein
VISSATTIHYLSSGKGAICKSLYDLLKNPLLLSSSSSSRDYANASQ